MPLPDTGLTIRFTGADEQYRSWSAGLLQLIYPEGSPRFGQEKSPDGDHFLTALFVVKEEAVLGRAVLYRNDGIRWKGLKTVLAGNYEAVRDEAVARCLLSAIEQYAAANGFDCVLGPMNGSTWDDYRFLVSPQERPFFTEPQQMDYYAESWRRQGFEEAGMYHSSSALLPADGAPAEEIRARLALDGIAVRPINVERLEDELRRLHPMVSEAFSHSPFYTLIPQDAFVDKFGRLRSLLDPDCTLIAVKAEAPVAFVLCLPDHYTTLSRTLVLKTIARQPGFEHPALIPLLGGLLYRKAAQKGYRHIIHAFMQSGNRSRIRSSQFGGEELRRYALFRKLVRPV